MGQYRLKANAGTHSQDGRIYGPGDIVESKPNLALLFREKFEALDSPQPVFVGAAGGRTGNELPQDHAGRDAFDDDNEADQQAKRDNADLDNDGVDDDKERIAEDVADNDEGSGAARAREASGGRPKKPVARTGPTKSRTTR